MLISPAGVSTATAGKNFMLECSADITPNPLPIDVASPRFEWFFGPTNTSLPSGVTVSDVTNSGNAYTSGLLFSPLQESHEGMYTCRLGGNERLAANTVVTVNGKLSTVLLLMCYHLHIALSVDYGTPAMIILIQPMDVIVNSKDSAVFSVTVVKGFDDEFTYQWQRNGSDLMETPGKFEGVKTAELTIKEAQEEDEGSYWCVITNGAGDIVTSNEAYLILTGIKIN